MTEIKPCPALYRAGLKKNYIKEMTFAIYYMYNLKSYKKQL